MAKHQVEDPVLRALPDLYALVRIEQFPAHTLRVARGVVGGDKGEYTEVDLATGDFRVFVDPEPAELHGLGEARSAARQVEVSPLATFLGVTPQTVRANLHYLASHDLAERVTRTTWRGFLTDTSDLPAPDGWTIESVVVNATRRTETACALGGETERVRGGMSPSRGHSNW